MCKIDQGSQTISPPFVDSFKFSPFFIQLIIPSIVLGFSLVGYHSYFVLSRLFPEINIKRTIHQEALSCLRLTKLIQGTFILTFVGILSRFMGFFFRMFTSHIFGEENVGLYQLIFPVYLFCLSLSTAGILKLQFHGLLPEGIPVANILKLSRFYIPDSFFCSFFFHNTNAASSEVCPLIAIHSDGDARCRSILPLPMLCPLLLSTVVSQDRLRSAKNLSSRFIAVLEQLVRISFVVVLHLLFQKNGQTPGILLAVLGIVVGEYCSALYSLACLHFFSCPTTFLRKFSHFFRSLRKILELMPTAFRLQLIVQQSPCSRGLKRLPFCMSETFRLHFFRISSVFTVY